jgi:hypothetical protein
MPNYESSTNYNGLHDKKKYLNMLNIDEYSNWYIETITSSISSSVFSTNIESKTYTIVNKYTNTLSQIVDSTTETSTLTTSYFNTTSCTYTYESLTLSTTETLTPYWKSTTYGRYDLAWYRVYSISTHASCYNTLSMYYTYINNIYTDYYYTSTTIAISSVSTKSTSTIYLSTTRKYTATSSLTSTLISTITNTSVYHYFYTDLYTDCNIITETSVLTSFTIDVLYYTVSKVLVPSPTPTTICNTMMKNNCNGRINKIMYQN